MYSIARLPFCVLARFPLVMMMSTRQLAYAPDTHIHTDQDSFERVRLWVKELKANAASTSSSPPLLFIAANKADLEHKRAVPMKDVEALARSIGDGAGGSGEPAPIFSTSAKTDKGVEAAFMDVARRLLVRHLRNEQRGKSNQNRGGSKRLVIQDDPLPRPKSKQSSCCST